MNASMKSTGRSLRIATENLIGRMHETLRGTQVIPWGSPVPSFGDLCKATVATLGLNPSCREFVDTQGKELSGAARRLHTLTSLGLKSWKEVEASHVDRILAASRQYFECNPYDGWFRALDEIIVGTGASYYDSSQHACHLDLIPYATACKWADLSVTERRRLLDATSDTLGMLLRSSQVRLLILNGQTVVTSLQKAAGVTFECEEQRDWSLPRGSGVGVRGLAYTGVIRQIGGVELDNPIQVVGYNHNIQSSFGVTTSVKEAIRDWVEDVAGVRA